MNLYDAIGVDSSAPAGLISGKRDMYLNAVAAGQKFDSSQTTLLSNAYSALAVPRSRALYDEWLRAAIGSGLKRADSSSPVNEDVAIAGLLQQVERLAHRAARRRVVAYRWVFASLVYVAALIVTIEIESSSGWAFAPFYPLFVLGGITASVLGQSWTMKSQVRDAEKLVCRGKPFRAIRHEMRRTHLF